MNKLELLPMPNIPLIQPGDDLAALLTAALQQNGEVLLPGDILILAQKIISKAEGCLVNLNEVIPSDRAMELAEETHKDPREVEVILWDTAQVIRTRPGLLIVEDCRGLICANAGLDRSNVSPEGEEIVLRLPTNPDATAARIRARLGELTGQHPPVLIVDSHGRPWRIGVIGVTIGVAGLTPVADFRGEPDLFGRRLKHTDVNVADQLASAASLVMGQGDEGCPAVIARELVYEIDEAAKASDILRQPEMDLFR